MIPDWETGSVFQAMRQEPVGVQQRKGGQQQPLRQTTNNNSNSKRELQLTVMIDSRVL
jgi:hypothetical protein